ncbi:GDSL-type esterase/lipase family protein, partial [Akkermansiaceae bacterium]|nr:GDSL-type esterase/lipase family protein [Akkermansiaceae bacterium]
MRSFFFLFLVLTVASLTAREPVAVIPPDSEIAGEGPVRRYEWFRNLWKDKRTAWAKEVEAKQGALVFLGDSITQSWGDDLKGAFGETKVANRGISGDTTRGILYRLPEDVLALNPTGVVLLMGTNDLEEGARPEVIAGNLALIIKKLKASSK